MTTLTSLPSEMIDSILSYSDISFEDIINFRCVCKKFQWSAKTNKYCFLKKKFYQRWLLAKKFYDEQFEENSEHQKSEENDEPKNMKCLNFIEKGIECVRQLREYVSKIRFLLKCDNTYFDKRERLKEDLSEITSKTENYIKMLFFMDEIKHILTQPLRPGCDLTEGYCYIQLFDYLRICWRKVILKRFVEEQHCKELLEDSAIVLAQQLQLGKNVSYSTVKASLNTIALDALYFVREKNYRHFILSTPDKCFSRWKNNNIDDNFWTEKEGIEIMDVLEEYMFDKLNFRSVDSRELEYMCIDYVLENKCGHNLILLIIYKSVARRLGLRCDIVIKRQYSNTELLWVPRYTFTEDSKYPLIDEQNKKNMRCFYISFDKFPDCINSYRYGTIEKLTFPKMLESTLIKELSVGFYTNVPSYNIRLLCEQIQSVSFEEKKQKPKFAVGMIVTHGDKSTDCSAGVIIGWHQNSFDNRQLYSPIGRVSDFAMPLEMCTNSNTTRQQTYYMILTNSDKLCCVEEDNITLAKPNWIENRNIYRYFSKFEGTHYLPNKVMTKVYPHDAAIAAQTIFKKDSLAIWRHLNPILETYKEQKKSVVVNQQMAQ